MSIRRPSLRSALIGTALAATVLTAGCAYPTPYQPATPSAYGGMPRNGFSDIRVESNRYRVSFSGNSLTSRETVERYLLFRAAQLTLEQGDDYFIMVNRDTEKKSRSYIQSDPFGPGPYGFWQPSWRYYSPAWGWRSWSPFWGDPFWANDVDVQTIDRYEATAEIVVGKGPKPNNIRAFDAHQVIENLGPTIVMPKQR